VWHLPAWLLAPDRLWGFLLVHGLWLTAVGVFAFLVLRRLVGRGGGLAFLGGALAVAWMPAEETRIATVQMIQYSGCAAGSLLATWLLLEAWHHRSRVLLLTAGSVTVVAALNFEASLPILGMAPLLLAFGADRTALRQRLRWAGGSLVLVAALAARAILPMLTGSEALSYQLGVPGSTRPISGVLWQIGLQLRHHLEPLASIRLAELATPAVAIAVLVFVSGFAVATRNGWGDSAAGPPRRVIAITGLLGLAHAILGYLPFVLTRGIRGPVRTEFLSAAGVAAFIAAAVMLIASLAPPRARLVLTAALGAWVVALGTGRTMALQREWDSRLYANQRRALQQITGAAPGLEQHTLLVLLQSGHTWMFSFSFSKAVEYLYRDAARGWVPGADPFLFETRLEQATVVSQPATVIRAPWREPIERYRYDELVVFAEEEGGRVLLLEAWPQQLGPLPAGATYAPRLRIRVDCPAPDRLAIVPDLR
jgi:hypothetical protein